MWRVGHLAKDCPQNKEPTTNSETFFSGMVCNDSCNVHPRNDVCADHSRDNSRAGVSRNGSRARDSRTSPVLTLILETGCVLKTFLRVRKDEVTFLDVQTDGVTLPVPVSSSRFSLGSAVVVGPRENLCSDMKLETDGGSDDSTPAPLAKSAEMKRLVGIAVANGTLNRIAYKTVRKRMRIEARRQKEPDEGVEPEVVLDSFLNQVKVEQQPQSGPLKRVLTPAAKAAKQRRARDKKLRETLCWWIANDKVCPHGDRCNFRHTVIEEKGQTVSEIGVSCAVLVVILKKKNCTCRKNCTPCDGATANPSHRWVERSGEAARVSFPSPPLLPPPSLFPSPDSPSFRRVPHVPPPSVRARRREKSSTDLDQLQFLMGFPSDNPP